MFLPELSREFHLGLWLNAGSDWFGNDECGCGVRPLETQRCHVDLVLIPWARGSTTWPMTTRNVLDLWGLPKLRISYSHSTMTNDERMQRESGLIATIRRKLPVFAKAWVDDAELVLLHQDAFAADYQEDEYTLLRRRQDPLKSIPPMKDYQGTLACHALARIALLSFTSGI
jgi:hypothetical protein